MTRESAASGTKPRKPPKPLPRNEDPEFYEGLGRAIKVARTAMGLERKELAEAAGVSYAYLSDIETGRGRPGSRSFLAIAQALGRSASELMREAEGYRAQITGEPFVERLAPSGVEPEPDLDTMIQRYSDAAPSPAARRWFHAGRVLAGVQHAELDAVEEHLGSFSEESEESSPVHDELGRAIAELSAEDAAFVLALVQRLRQGR